MEPVNLSKIIGEYEYKKNGLEYFQGSSVQVLNMRIGKSVVHADVILQTQPGEPFEALRGCQYPARFFLANAVQGKNWFLGIEHMTADDFQRIFWKGRLVDCFLSSMSKSETVERAKKLATVCKSIELQGHEPTFLAVTKRYIDFFGVQRMDTKKESREIVDEAPPAGPGHRDGVENGDGTGHGHGAPSSSSTL